MTTRLDPLRFPLNGTRLIEAGAGTGKTYTITSLYLRLVLGHGGENGFQRPLTPPEILVVTFTNAATEELRDRIRRRLSLGAAFFRGESEGDDFLRGLGQEIGSETRGEYARRLTQAAQWMDEAAVYTIHGWCQRMLRQHAFDSDALFDLDLETDEEGLLETAACDYWRSRFYPMKAGEVDEIVRTIRCTTPQALLDQIRPWLSDPPDSLGDPFAMVRQRRKAVEAARQAWKDDFDGAVARIRRAQQDKTLKGNMYRAGSLAAWIDEMDAWVRRGGPLPRDNALEKMSASGLARGTARGKSAPAHWAYDALDELNGILAGLPVAPAMLAHAAAEIGERFRREKARRAQIGYDDLLTRLHNALYAETGPRLAGLIRRQYPVAFIDEFQDTDPVQYAIYRRIYLDRDECVLVMIGDPKQGIYAFRGADIHAYLRARQDVGDRRHSLDVNYRSVRGMVAAVNRLFARAAQDPQGPFLFGERIPFSPAEARGRPEQWQVDSEPAPAMTLWRLPQEDPVAKTGEGGYLGQMAAATAREIVRLLEMAGESPSRAGFQTPDGAFRPLTPADVAVLVRDGTEARYVRGALEAYGMASVYLSDRESVFSGPEAVDLIHLLRACAEPNQPRRIKSALATRILDLPLHRLDALTRDEVLWEKQVDRFHRYRRIWEQRGVLPMLRALMGDFAVPAGLLAASDGERRLTNLLHLAELLQETDASLEGAQALVRWLAEQVARNPAGREERILRLESDASRIRVVTIHKAKGLEYPLVFLPFACTFREAGVGSMPLLRYRDGQGRRIETTAPTPADRAAADRERLAEDLRLLYVAVTRSIHACWIGMGVLGRKRKDGTGSRLHLSAMGHLIASGAPVSVKDLADVLADLAKDCSAIKAAPLPDGNSAVRSRSRAVSGLEEARAFAARVPRNWWITSYSALAAGARRDDVAGSDPQAAGAFFPDSPADDQLREDGKESAATSGVAAAGTIHQFPRGPEPGTFLHGILEWGAVAGFDALAADREQREAGLADFCRRSGLSEWFSVLSPWFRALLRTPMALPGPGGPVALERLTPDACRSEMEFLFAANRVEAQAMDRAVTEAILPGQPRPSLDSDIVNGMLKGFIDLVFCHGGRYFVLDYKSNHLGPDNNAYAGPVMARAILDHRYDLQYVLYTLALHRLLRSRVPQYRYEDHVGGVVYLFLRGVDDQGHGVYVDRPPVSLIAGLDDRFADGKGGFDGG